MKVFLATLLVFGYAVAVPCPIVNNLMAQLVQDVKDIQAHTMQLILKSADHAKEDVPAFVKNPQGASEALLKNIASAAREVILTTTSDINKMNGHIRTAIDKLKEVEAARPLLPILDNLVRQLVATTREARTSVFQQLQQASSQVGVDIKALLADPAGASRTVQDRWNTHHSQFVSGGEMFALTVQLLVQDTIDRIQAQFYQ